MRSLLAFLIVITAFALAAFPRDVSATPPPASAFGALEVVPDAAISPDGSKIIIALNEPERSTIRIFERNAEGGLTLVQAASVGEKQSVRGVGFANDKIATVVVSQTLTAAQATAPGWRRKGSKKLYEYFRVVSFNLETGRLTMLTTSEEHGWAFSSLAKLIAPIDGEEDSGRMMSPTNPKAGADFALYRVNLRTSYARSVEVFGTNAYDIVVDSRGDAVVRAESDDEKNEWTVFGKTGGAWLPVLSGTSETGAAPSLLGLFPDGRLGFYRLAGERGVDELVALDLKDGSTTAIYRNEEFDQDKVVRDPWSHEIVGVEWTDNLFPRQKFFDPALAAVYAKLTETFDPNWVSLVSWSKDKSALILFGEAPDGRDKGSYYIYDVAADRLSRLGEGRPALADAFISPVQSVVFRARDKTPVPLVLTTPEGSEGQKLPAIVLVHGGPFARDAATFDYWAQFLASRGYAVLQPNFRGSDGFGAAWLRAGYGEWGGLMQTDVEDAVHALGRAGIIDTARVCIVGASYGGYAALAGATLTPDLYRCAVSVNGVTDLVDMLKGEIAASGKSGFAADYWQRSIGRLKEDRARIEAVSPARNAERVTIPVLLIHGAQDSVVPIGQSRLMADRLKDAKKDVNFVTLKGEDHWLSDAETRTRMLEELETFLAKHLPVN